MKKHLQSLLLIVALMLPWSTMRAQMLSEYTFHTGVDATKWISASSWTNIWSTYQDDQASSVYNLGFAFPFGMGSYTQFSVSSNGIFHLGADAASSGTTAGQFTSSYYQTSLPKICGIARDLGTGSNGYVRYALTGTAPNRVFVCEFAMGYTYGSSYTADVKWQVQLHEDSSKVVIVYGPSAPGTTPSSFQTGLAETSDDIIILNPSTHAPIYSSTYYATTYSTWHGANRYYSFTRPIITCPRPVSLTVENLEVDGFDIHWTDTTDATSWLVRLGTNGTPVLATDTSYSFTSLNDNTAYNVSVAGICSNGDTSAWRTVSLRTPCAYMTTLPYVQDFEAATAGSSTSETFVNCMTRLNNGTQYFGYPYVNSSAIYNHTPNGSKGLYWYNNTTTGTYGDYQVVVMPGVDTDYFPARTLRVAFWARSSATSYNPTFYVGVMTNPNDISTFQYVDTISVGNSTQWRLYESDLSSYTGDGRFVAIRANRQSSYWYAYVDDITLMVNPSCDHPTDLVISDVNSEGFTATWHGDLTNASGYYVVLDTVGGTDEMVVYDTTVTFYNLPAGRRCTFSVSSLCSLGDTTMAMTTIVTTYCDALTTLPYTYGFEGLNTGTNTERPVIPCWHHLNNGTSYYGYPYVTSTAHNGSRSLYWYASTTQSTYGDYQIAVLPPVDTDIYAINTLMLDFWARPSSTSYSPVFQVGVMSDPNDASTFQMVSTVNVQNVTDWQHFEVMLNDFAGSGQFVAVRANRPSSSWYAYTDDFRLREIPACPHVVDLVSTHVTSDTIEVTWQPVGSETMWLAVIGSDTNVAYDTTYIFDNLMTNTPYTISVAPLCDNGDTGDFISIQVRTLCGGLALPYFENFEGVTGSTTTSVSAANNNLPPCWNFHNVGTSSSYSGYPMVYNSSSYAHSGTQAMRYYIYTTSGTYADQIAIMPEIDTTMYPMSRLVLKFWHRANSTSYTSTCIVGVMTDPTDASTFHTVETITTTSTTYTLRTVSFENYTGPAGRIAFKFPRPTSNYNYGYVDDITLELTPDCPAVSNVTATSVGPNDVDLTWTENGIASAWTVEYGPTGFTPGNGITDYVFSLPYSITSLTPNTEYTIRITPDCTTGDGIAGTAIATFRTSCSYIDSLPLVQDFESAPTGGSTSNTWIECWTRLNNGTQYYGWPYVSSSSSYNHTENGSKGLYWYNTTTTGTYGDYQYVVLPGLDTDVIAMNSVMFSFWVKSSSTSYYPVFQVGVMTSPTDPSTFQQVASINVGNNTAWTLKEVSFENFTGNGNFIALRALRPSSSWYAYVDDLRVELLPDCPRVNNITVNNITTTSAAINWTDANATSWELEYGPVGFTRGTGSTETAYGHPYTITGLTSNTAYTIYITPTCDGVAAESSINFRTECEPEISLPITMGFESSDGISTTGSSTSDVFVDCWHRLNNGTMYFGYPYVGSSTTYAHTGSRGLYWYNTTTTGTYGDYQIVVLPGIDPDMYAINTLQLKFWAKNSSASSPASFDIGVMTDPNNASTFQQLSSVNVTGTDWNEFTNGLANYHGNGIYVAIRAMRSSWTAYVDDITLEVAPTCPAVSSINAETIGTTGAQFSWNLQSGFADVPTSYEAEVYDVTTSLFIGSYTPMINQTLVTGLQPNTEYKFRVRPQCGTEYGGWDSITFSTSGLPCIVPDPNSTYTMTLNDGAAGTDYYLPLNNFYNYTYTQQLVLASEMNGPSTITGIDFQYGYSSASTVKSNCTIYLANVSVNDLSSSFVTYSPTTFQMVYTGNLNCNSSNSGWNHFNFTTPFVYTGGNLLIVVHDNSGDYDGSSYVFNHHSTPAAMGRHIYQDGSAYNITSPGTGTAVNYRTNMKLYTYGCLQTGTCAAPMVVVDSMGSNYIDVSWAPGYQESSWDVEFRRDDSTAWTNLGLTTATNASITGLTPNYTYHIRVTGHCTDTDMASILTVVTPCTPDTLPFFSSFEDFPGSSVSYPMPPCWVRHSNYYDYYPYSSTSYAHGGSKAVYVYSTNSTYSYFTLPPMDAPIDSLYVNFWLLRTNTSYTHAVKVGVMSDPQDVSTFIEIGTATPQGLYQWENFEFYLDSYTGNGQYIAFMSPNGVYSYPYMDDLTVDRIPNCRRIQGIIVDNITQTSAHASWIAGDVTEFDAVCVPYGMDPDSGNIINIIGEDSVTFTGLTHSTSYQVYVRGYCYPDTSAWSMACLFRTACGMIDSLPYVEDLETVNPGSSNTGDAFIPCWTRLNNGSSYGGYPYVSSSTSYNHTPGGNRGLYWYNTTTTGSYGDYQYIVFPQIDTLSLPINTIQVSFWAKSSSTSYFPSFEVGVMNDVNDTAMDVLRSFQINGETNWQEFVVPLGGYTGHGSYIAIRSLRATSSWYAYVDDFRLDTMPSCPAPTEVALDSATGSELYITIHPSGSESSWEVSYGTTSFPVYTPSFNITGLTPNTPYTISVRALCDAGDTSEATIATFRTSCGMIDSLPFLETFESHNITSSSSPAFLPCWSRLSDATTYYYPYLSNSTTYNHTSGGSKGFYWYCSSTTSSYGSYQMIVTPVIDTDLYPINTLQYSFWAKSSSSSYNVWFEVGVITGENAQSFVTVDTVHVGTNTTWAQYDVPLSRFTGSGNRIALRARYALSNSYWYAYVDDISIDVIPTCPHVGSFSVSNTGYSSVTLSWTERGTATEWQTHVDSVANAIPTGDSTILNIPGITYNGLTPGQNYYFWCRPVCGPGDTGAWEGPVLGIPNSWTMRTGMSDSITMCGGTVFDDGGPNGDYTNSQNSSVTIYPATPGSLIQVQGTFAGEGCCDYLGIYDGVGTGGTQFHYAYGSSGSTLSIGPYTSESGPITITFSSDPSVTYPGFALNITCITTHCRVTNIRIDPTVPASSSQLAVTWDTCGAISYEVEYGTPGFTLGTGTQLTTYTNSVIIPGLTSLTTYEVYVRAICGVGDTGDWSHTRLQTTLCDNAQLAATGDENATGTSYHSPLNNYYNYTLTETIFDSAEIGGPMDIGYISYYYNYSLASTVKTNCTIYLKPTNKTVFTSGSDIELIDSTALMVYTGPLNCSQGWNFFTLDTIFHYDGTTNLMVIVDDNSGDYDGSDYVFKTNNCSGYKTIEWYSDSYNPSPTSTSFSGTQTYYTYRVVMQLLSCGTVPTCRAPYITTPTTTYQSANISWSGTGNSYEVAVKAVSDPVWPTETAVTGTTYTFTGLQPATAYQFRVRQDCSADSLGYSDWANGSFVTDSMPCLAPSNLTVSNATNVAADFSWTVRGNETAWSIHVWNTTYDSVYTATTNPVTLGGFSSATTYNASIRALCGTSQNIEGEWGDTIQFSMGVCAGVTGLTASNVTANSITISWNAVTGAQGYYIEYGTSGFAAGTGNSVTVTTTTYTAVGLTELTAYEFHIKTVCATGWMSEQWAQTSAVTSQSTVPTYTVTVNSANPTQGSVMGGGSYPENSSATITATANYGYHFTQWNDNVTTNPRTLTVTQDTAFMAYFAANQYTITVVSANPTMGSVSGSGTYNYGNSVTISATPNNGYHFVSWNDGDTNATRSITVAGDSTFTATFAVNMYTVTAVSEDESKGTVTGGGQYAFGDVAHLVATSNSGYQFLRWSDNNADSVRDMVVVADVSLTAYFVSDTQVVNRYTVTLNVNDPTMGHLTTTGGQYNEGDSFTVEAIANNGYHFVNWSDNVTDNPRTITVTSDLTLTANFAQNADNSATLTVSVNDATMGYVTINGQETETYNGQLGDAVTLKAWPYEGYEFASWSDGETSAERSYTLTERNASLTATFRRANGIDGVAEAGCRVYPNPANGYTTVSVTGISGKVRIALLDLTGRELKVETLECAADCEKRVELDALAQGAYYIRITSEGNAPMVKKLIVR